MRSNVEALEKQVTSNKGALLERPTELRGRKALVAVEVRQLWIMGQQCGLLMEVKDVKLQDAAQECPL
ncbi:unnamed protein product [Symbiodinium natans]|uniref:Uncharacterized protein n=1 Tax=Symbiodinium natans TaxID=878477 RepID=A0A812QBL9_9DINO|nr:unnamed protein product [Symbiodinium natans]